MKDQQANIGDIWSHGMHRRFYYLIMEEGELLWTLMDLETKQFYSESKANLQPSTGWRYES